MGDFELIPFPSSAALAEAAAREWLALTCDPKSGPGFGPVNVAVNEEAGTKPSPPRSCGQPRLVALSGGRIAGSFFAATARLARETGHPAAFAETHFFWADERCVPPDDPDSNFALAQHLLFDPLGLSGSRVHRIRGELAPGAAAQAAADELQSIAPRTPTGPPVLDLVFLGMGEDGHVASLFPGEPEALMADPAVYRPVVAVKPPPHRITLGYAALCAARQVWVMVSGKGKTAALRESLSPGGKTPLGNLLGTREFTRLLVDQDA